MGFLRSAFLEVRSVVRAETDTHRGLRDRLLAVGVVSAAVCVLAAALELAFERHAPGTRITNYGDALFWVAAQLLTVSSQLPNPLTTGGRILDVFLEAYAITVVASMAGSFGAFFHRRGDERRAAAAGSAS